MVIIVLELVRVEISCPFSRFIASTGAVPVYIQAYTQEALKVPNSRSDGRLKRFELSRLLSDRSLK